MPKFLAGLSLALALSFAPIAQANAYQHSITIVTEDEEYEGPENPEHLDKLIDCPNNDPDEEAPKIAPTSPATKARRIALARVIKFALPFLLAGIHQGPCEPAGCELLINPSSYSFVASNKPSPRGMSEVTHLSVSPLRSFPASRRAIVFGSR